MCDDDRRTRVGHTKESGTDVYVGRGRGGRHLLTVTDQSRGWLGNPFTVEEYDREESIRRFREAFEDKLESDSEFRAAVADLAGENLGCWCRRLDDDGPRCHGDVIAEHADRLADAAGLAAQDVERFYREREQQYRELNARAHADDGKFIVDCPGCETPMVLGDGWMGCAVPECPDCNDTADEWRDDPRISEARAAEVADGDAPVRELVRP